MEAQNFSLASLLAFNGSDGPVRAGSGDDQDKKPTPGQRTLEGFVLQVYLGLLAGARVVEAATIREFTGNNLPALVFVITDRTGNTYIYNPDDGSVLTPGGTLDGPTAFFLPNGGLLLAPGLARGPFPQQPR
ncbi:MAG: hypothetical protein R3F55_13205 [Alphaproteobacteria bacterium]